jgi:hypothetical protein
VLGLFLDWLAETGLVPYPAQEEALLELYAGKHVVLSTPTGSGKSLVALALHFKALAEGRRSFYTSPIKALASEKFFALCDELGARAGGDAHRRRGDQPGAPVICCTAEVLMNMALREGAGLDAPYVVMDEFHYYADAERGVAWQVPLLVLPHTRFLLMSATLGDTSPIEERLAEETGVEVASVRSGERPVPLDFDYRETPLHETVEELVASGRAPIYVVSFTQRECAERAQALTSMALTDKEAKRRDRRGGRRLPLRHPLRQGAAPLPLLRHRRPPRRAAAEVPAARRAAQPAGAAAGDLRHRHARRRRQHPDPHGALHPALEVRRAQGRPAQRARLPTDRRPRRAQGLRRPRQRRLPGARARDREQAGRGQGRRRRQEAQEAGQEGPRPGDVPWTERNFRELIAKPPETLESRFRLTHGMVLELLQRDAEDDDPAARNFASLRRLVAACHETPETKRSCSARRRCWCARCTAPASCAWCATSTPYLWVTVDPDLQFDFSLHHTLSLFLVEAMARLDKASPEYALDALSLAESILEDPTAVLRQQAEREKQRVLAELKEAYVPYEERVERLREITTRSRRTSATSYGTFEGFRDLHPWVGTRDIRPKMVGREMFERYWSFHDFVREYGLARSEGVLLRYLSQLYKTLAQSVPEVDRTPELDDVLAFFRTLVERIDKSLLEEWESLLHPELALARREAEAPRERPADRLAADPGAFAARLRAELHHLVRALAARDWDEAAAAVRQDPADPWPPERFEAALAPYHEEHGDLPFGPEARRHRLTTIRPAGERRWQVTQTLLDPEEDGLWHVGDGRPHRRGRPHPAARSRSSGSGSRPHLFTTESGGGSCGRRPCSTPNACVGHSGRGTRAGRHRGVATPAPAPPKLAELSPAPSRGRRPKENVAMATPTAQHPLCRHRFQPALAAAFIAVLLATVLPAWTADAQPSAWPGESEWIAFGTDPDEGGASNDFRDVSVVFYQVREGYLFLRMQTLADAGWPTTGASGRARYKWFFDTAGNDGEIQGGNVRHAEFLLMVEDLTLNSADPTLTRDRLGELTFLDALNEERFVTRWNSTNPPAYTTNTPDTAPSPSPYWRRLMGSGTAGTGGPQGVMGAELGYRILDDHVDMYLAFSLLGNPASPLHVLWMTDQQDNNLDQAPCCDRPESDEFIPLVTTGDISIVKEAAPESAQAFAFTGDLGAFALVDDGIASNSQDFLSLAPGSFAVTETVPAGWSLGAIVCDGDTDGGSVINLAGATVTIDLDPGEEIHCTFHDTALPPPGEGTITIVKDAIPDGPQSFSFTGDLGAFALSDSSPTNKSVTFTGLTPGSYDVTETVPAGWDLTGLTCSDPDSGTTVDLGTATATIDLDDGEVVTCTFIDVQRGSITIAKTALGSGSPPSFEFTGDFGAFSLADGASTTFDDLVPGSYVVTETVPAGWMLAELSCDDPDGGSGLSIATATVTVDLDAGENITCTFVDAVPATLIVAKDAVPPSPQDFVFASGFGPFTLDDAVPDDGDAFGSSVTFTGLSPGEVGIAEAVPSGWALTDIVCDDPTADSSVDPGTASAVARLSAGETVTCTFVNTLQAAGEGTLTIVKQAFPQSATSFDFGGDLGLFSLVDDGLGANSITVPSLAPGVYEVFETVPAGWSLGSISCDDPDEGSSVDLATATVLVDLDAGETVTCTFFDTEIPVELGTITIVKDSVPNAPRVFQFLGDLGSFVLSDGGPAATSISFPGLTPGTYAIEEVVPADWRIDGIECSDPDSGTTVDLGTATALVDLDAGEAVTCTFRNRLFQPFNVLEIPTLSAWALALLTLLLAAAGAIVLRRL